MEDIVEPEWAKARIKSYRSQRLFIVSWVACKSKNEEYAAYYNSDTGNILVLYNSTSRCDYVKQFYLSSRLHHFYKVLPEMLQEIARSRVAAFTILKDL
jgi:hypothetical protein